VCLFCDEPPADPGPTTQRDRAQDLRAFETTEEITVMYTAEQIAKRRAVKAETLEELTAMAIIGKMGVRTLWREEPLDLAARLGAFWQRLDGDDAAKETLRTAKGCTAMPAGAKNRDTILLEFLQDHAVGARRESCGSNFAGDCALWAAQPVDRNRGNQALRELWTTCSGRMATAKREAEDEFREFYGKPNQRPPRTPDEAKYYLVWARHEPGMRQDLWEDLQQEFEKDFPNHYFEERWTWERTGSMKPADFAPRA
jgi:hypothetical protein